MTNNTLKRRITLVAMVLACCAATPAIVLGAAPAASQSASAQTAAAEPEQFNWQRGPRDIPLIDQAVLKLPQGYGYLEADDARRLLRKLGNPHVDSVMGLITGPGGDWFVTVTFNKAGYVKDDDAKDWKADELLDGLKKGTEESNKIRHQQGIPEMEIAGWVEKPHYDPTGHRLVWAISTKSKGSAEAEDQGINYNTYALGRDGYFSLNLVTGLKQIEQDKPYAATLLAALDYKDGKKYTDFNSSTDHVAAYGLAALVAGVAAKKLGLLAVVLAFLAKFAKVGIVAALGGFAAIGKLFKRNK